MSYTQCIAIDCEMVSGPRGENMAARVTLVDENGRVLLDEYIKPAKMVSDYRTQVSGVTAAHLASGGSPAAVNAKVERILNGRILIGHSLDADLEALGLTHEPRWRRDLALYPPFKRMNGGQPASLKFLAQQLLGKHIQNGPHSSVEDAKASMEIYRRVANDWHQ